MTEPVGNYDYSGLRAMYINCTLKRSPDKSHTQGLVDRSVDVMRKHGVDVEVLRAVDHDIATGVYPDMTQHGWASDEWPQIHERVMASHVLVICGPIWLGDNSSVTKQIIERLTRTPQTSTSTASPPTTGGSAVR